MKLKSKLFSNFLIPDIALLDVLLWYGSKWKMYWEASSKLFVSQNKLWA